MNNIGIDIGKSKCVVCIMDHGGEVLEETIYTNTSRTTALLARYAVDKYGPSRAACESTGNLWQKTFTASEKAGIPIILPNPFKTKAIAESSVKTDKVDARVLAGLLRADMMGKCHVADAEGSIWRLGLCSLMNSRRVRLIRGGHSFVTIRISLLPAKS